MPFLWTGSASPDTTWGNGGNWNEWGLLPYAGDSATFDLSGNPTVTTDSTTPQGAVGVYFTNSGTLTLNGALAAANTMTFASGQNLAGSATFNSAVAFNGSTVSGSPTFNDGVTFSGSNTINGAVAFSALTVNGTLGGTGVLNIGAGATVNGSATLNLPVTLNGGTLAGTFNVPNLTLGSAAGAIGSTSSNSLTIPGSLALNSGTLTLTGTLNTGGAVTVNSGGTLAGGVLGGTITDPVSLVGGTLSGTLNIAGNLTSTGGTISPGTGSGSGYTAGTIAVTSGHGLTLDSASVVDIGFVRDLLRPGHGRRQPRAGRNAAAHTRGRRGGGPLYASDLRRHRDGHLCRRFRAGGFLLLRPELRHAHQLGRDAGSA